MAIKGKLEAYKIMLENFSYMTILQIFILLTPLITYPYLTRVLGTELYGLVITAQILAGYATTIVKFGFDSVSARHISINRDDKSKLSDIMSSILTVRAFLWLLCFIVYCSIVLLVPVYRTHLLLFIFSYGLTLNVLLFPQFFFQGIERMKYITYINIGIQSIFILLTFLIIRQPSDYVYVPLLHSIGFLLGGIASLYIIYTKYNLTLCKPAISDVKYYFRDALPLFATDAICTVKDKLNYLLLGAFVSMSDVVVYDLGSKLLSLAILPLTIINTVVFPKMAKSTSNGMFYKVGLLIFILIAVMILLINIFLGQIVHIFIADEVPLLPIRIFLISPLFLGIGSYIGSSFIIARGYSKYMFYSIIVTVSSYIVMLLIMLFTHQLNTVISFIVLAVISYFVEMVYRLWVSFKLITIKNETN